ncbi:hypothetical protein Ahy_A04g017341 isoform C [Arachis hypogaea]|uniref:Uncharacterized protein n=1 Tax=Arachis hypogaea TaxID=3818 RepID=A0A444WN95_ARAHY|nr:hypothetical protein Ahy_Scaffold8g108480 isoform C [Arachis hypogaea]RYR60267.1 hypothetical protein Ahy_A04g017341 isoform C [Arachis hypogaea]
MCCYASMLA